MKYLFLLVCTIGNLGVFAAEYLGNPELKIEKKLVDFGSGAKEVSFLKLRSSLFLRESAREYKILIKNPKCTLPIVEQLSSIRSYFELSYLLDTSPKHLASSLHKIDQTRNKIIGRASGPGDCTKDLFIVGAVYATLEVFYGKNNFLKPEVNEIGDVLPPDVTGQESITFFKEKSLDNYLNFLLFHDRIWPLDRSKLESLPIGSTSKIVGIYACEEQNIEVDRMLAPYDLAATIAHELMHQRFSLRINSKSKLWGMRSNDPYFKYQHFNGVENYYAYFDELLAVVSGSFMQAMLFVELESSSTSLKPVLLSNDFSFANFPKEWSYEDAMLTLTKKYAAQNKRITPELKFGWFLWKYLDASRYLKSDSFSVINRRKNKTQEFYRLIENLESKYFPDLQYRFHPEKYGYNQFVDEFVRFFEKESFDLVFSYDDNKKYEDHGRKAMTENSKLKKEPHFYGLVPVYSNYRDLIDQLNIRVCNNDDMPGAEGVGISRKYKSCIAIGN